MITQDQWIKAYNQLAKENDSRIVDIPDIQRYRDDTNQQVVDMRDNTTGSFTEQELTEALTRAESAIAEDEALEVAKGITIDEAKDYLRRQLIKENPNVGQIYTQIKSVVDSNAVLSQMVDNQMALMITCIPGFAIDLLNITGASRARYILCVQLVIATLG